MDHDPNQSDGRLNEPGGTDPRGDGPPEAAQHCPRLGRPWTVGKCSPWVRWQLRIVEVCQPKTRKQAHALAVDQSGGPLPALTPMRPARDGGQCRGSKGLTVTQTDLNCRGGGGILLIGCGLHDSHITGPIRGRVEAHATTCPGARRSGSPGKSGEPAGDPGAFKWYPELGRSQGVPAPGRRTRNGWGPPALGGPTKCHGSS